MNDEDLVDRFYDATFDEDEVDHESFLSKGGEEILGAVRVHQLFQAASKSWKEPKRPEQLGRFQIVGDLGAGGIGRVYLGWDPELRRHVAIKVISRDRWASNEARSIAKLDHRSIVKVYEVGRDHLVMELLDGGTLQDKIKDLLEGFENNMSSLRARMHCLVRIAEGLAYCHERGILHRDVKPSNVLFAQENEHPRLIDFGLAHLDELESLDITQNLVGSPAYLAPEQVESGETGSDNRSDIFSFGSLAYELLTLRSPFKRDTRQETLDAVSAARPVPARTFNPEISRSVQNILEHCMEPDARNRYRSMQEVVLDLQDALANRPISVGSRSILHRANLFMQRHKRVSGFLAMGVGVATLVTAGVWLQSVRMDRVEFADELQALALRIPAAESGSQLTQLGLALMIANKQAEVLDRSVPGRLFMTATPHAYQAAESWSRHLASTLESISDFENGIFPPAGWRGILNLDEAMLPDATWNAEVRNRGRVTLAPELASNPELVAYKEGPVEPFGQFSRDRTYFKISLPAFPDRGLYRLEIPGVWQREFLVQSIWCTPIHVEFQQPRLDSSDWTHLEELGLLISPPITYRQMHEFNEAFVRDHPTSDAPYQGPMERCQAYADWAGGRLPTGIELDALFPSHLQPAAKAFLGEHITDGSTRWPLEQGTHYSYEARLTRLNWPLFNRVDGELRSMVDQQPMQNFAMTPGGYLFRVVYLAGESLRK